MSFLLGVIVFPAICFLLYYHIRVSRLFRQPSFVQGKLAGCADLL